MMQKITWKKALNILACGLVGAAVLIAGCGDSKTSAAVAEKTPAKQEQQLSSARNTPIVRAAKKVGPAVVGITNKGYVRDFFNRVYFTDKGTGSGVIYDKAGYIATNNHVVSGAESLTITFCDDEAVPGIVKGTDPSVDLAVVAVSWSDVGDKTKEVIKVATIGDSSGLTVGESAIVIGNALGYGQSVTTGVISAMEREVQLQDDSGKTIKNKLIQTDAAVNPGNSGGALLNMKGEVVGVVSAKYSDTQVEGMGYAIPISSAKSIIETLINQEVVSQEKASYFGIAGVDVTQEVSRQYDMPTGIYVTRVAANSGASKAGIKKGDIITSFNGRSITSMEEISDMMQYIPAGSEVDVVVAQAKNNYEEATLKVTLTNKK